MREHVGQVGVIKTCEKSNEEKQFKGISSNGNQESAQENESKKKVGKEVKESTKYQNGDNEQNSNRLKRMVPQKKFKEGQVERTVSHKISATGG